MSKALKQRLSDLEKKCESGSMFYCYKWDVWFSVGYWVQPKGKMTPALISISVGPFRSAKAARDWSLADLRKEHPRTYERLLKERSLEDLSVERYLVVSPLPEYVQGQVESGLMSEDEGRELLQKFQGSISE